MRARRAPRLDGKYARIFRAVLSDPSVTDAQIIEEEAFKPGDKSTRTGRPLALQFMATLRALGGRLPPTSASWSPATARSPLDSTDGQILRAVLLEPEAGPDRIIELSTEPYKPRTRGGAQTISNMARTFIAVVEKMGGQLSP